MPGEPRHRLAKGYRPRHRNWRGPRSEIDLVVSKGQEIVFVEVKTRGSTQFGGASAAVDAEKQRALTRAAMAYLSRFGLWDSPCRFDVITIERVPRFPFWRLRHLRNAFSPELGRIM